MDSGESKDPPSPRRSHASSEGVSFGDELRREREIRGIELSEIAEATKVNLRFLESMESNQFDTLPGGLFTRGFIRAYANHIGADPDRLINAYLLQVAGGEDEGGVPPHSGPRLETYADEAAEQAAEARHIPWPWIIGAAVVIVPLAVFLLSPGLLSGKSPETPAPAIEPAAPTPAAPQPERVLEVTAATATEVRISCDGQVRVDREVRAGASVTVRCAGKLELDASSAGDLGLTLDGEDLGSPGEPGAPLRQWSPPSVPAPTESGP